MRENNKRARTEQKNENENQAEKNVGNNVGLLNMLRKCGK